MKYLLTITLVIISTICFGQTSDTARITTSPLKSMTAVEYDIYLQGKPARYTAVADAYGYPSAQSALEQAATLKLSAGQKQQLQTITAALDFKAKEMGRFILAEEKKLNDLFSTGRANEGSVIYFTNKLGLYEGELRNAHLQARLKTKAVLNPEQLKKLQKLATGKN